MGRPRCGRANPTITRPARGKEDHAKHQQRARGGAGYLQGNANARQKKQNGGEANTAAGADA